jgi:hypothetical protein
VLPKCLAGGEKQAEHSQIFSLQNAQLVAQSSRAFRKNKECKINLLFDNELLS